jgi:putative ABC transport system permease protein
LLSGKQLSFLSLVSWPILISALGLIVVIGLLAGSYPAFYLTSFSAVEVLKGKVRTGLKSKGIRSGLVIFQFALSILLIICTSTVYQQVQFLQERNAGLDKHNVLVIRNTSRLETNQAAFKNSIITKNGIKKASFTNNVFPGVNNITVFRDGFSRKDHVMGTYYADYDHADVLKFELVSGRYFSKDFPSDSMAVVVNEAAAKELGWEKPLEEKLIVFGGDQSKGIVKEIPMNVIGVVKDFNFESYKSKVRPMVIQITEKSNNLLVRYSGNPENVINEATKLWKEQSSGDPFEYSFLDQNFDQLFREEQRLGKLFTVFTVLAIFIASLGLFALAAFTAEQRTKEIGIRKAMGASVGSITVLLSKEFALLVTLSIVIAVIPAYYLLDYWLNQFAYRIEITLFIFAISALGALVIAGVTIGFQAVKAALLDPVKSLRIE